MTHLQHFQQQRPRLFGIAYRMLGSVEDAEDLLQDAYLRWSGVDLKEVENPQAFLSTTVSRMSIDGLRRRQRRTVDYPGPWLPEPLPTCDAPPSENLLLAESLTMAFLVLLEKLSPLERAVFLLREVFEYEYAEVASVVDKSEVYCRKILSRAKRKVKPEEAPPRPGRAVQDGKGPPLRLIEEFLQGLGGANLSGLESLLKDDLELHSDGGGKVAAALVPIRGASKVARFLQGLSSRYQGVLDIEPTSLNCQPAILVKIEGRLDSAVLLDLGPDVIEGIWIVRNPDKISHLKN